MSKHNIFSLKIKDLKKTYFFKLNLRQKSTQPQSNTDTSHIQLYQIYKNIINIQQYHMIKSSFKKIQKPSDSQKSYFGHPHLDAIFNNTLSKGHLMTIEEDHPTTNYLSLLRYYITSNYHKNIPSVIFDSNPQKWHHLISPILIKKEQKIQNKQKSQIAWRYDKMNINLNNLVISHDIDFIDLSKEVQKPNYELLKVQSYPTQNLKQFYKNIEQQLYSIHDDSKDTRPKKILLSTLPSYIYNHVDFFQFLRALRCLTRSSHVFTLLTVPPIISEEVRNKVIQYSDYYLQLGGVGPSYSDFNASLKILKEVQACQIRTTYRGETIWGIKNKKRQLQIEGLYEQAVEEDTETQNSKPICSQEQKVDF